MAREDFRFPTVYPHGADQLSIAMGVYPAMGQQYKFGFNAAVGTTEETVWSQGGLYSYLSSESTVTLSSDSAGDSTASTGAHSVQIYGLDGNYDEVDETLNLNGQSPVTASNSYLRVNRMIVRSAGAGEDNDGSVYIGTGSVTSGVPSSVVASIAPGDNQTLMCLWTVPRGKTAYLNRVTASTFGNANATMTVRLVARPEGEVFQTKDKIVITRALIELNHHTPISFSEKTDLEIRGVSSSGDIDLSAALDMVVRNDAA